MNIKISKSALRNMRKVTNDEDDMSRPPMDEGYYDYCEMKLNESDEEKSNPTVPFEEVEKIFNNAKENNYQYNDVDRKKFMTAVKEADCDLCNYYSDEDKKQIQKWYDEIWKAHKNELKPYDKKIATECFE